MYYCFGDTSFAQQDRQALLEEIKSINICPDCNGTKLVDCPKCNEDVISGVCPVCENNFEVPCGCDSTCGDVMEFTEELLPLLQEAIDKRLIVCWMVGKKISVQRSNWTGRNDGLYFEEIERFITDIYGYDLSIDF